MDFALWIDTFRDTYNQGFKWEDYLITPYGLKNESKHSPENQSITPVSSDSDKFDQNNSLSNNKSDEKLKRTKIKYEDLQFSKKSKLGSGSTASVILVKYKEKPYALKVIEWSL